MIYKINSKWIKGLDIRTKIIHPVEESMREKLHDLGFGHDFFDVLLKAQTKKKTKEVNWLCTKGVRKEIHHPK